MTGKTIVLNRHWKNFSLNHLTPPQRVSNSTDQPFFLFFLLLLPLYQNLSYVFPEKQPQVRAELFETHKIQYELLFLPFHIWLG